MSQTAWRVQSNESSERCVGMPMSLASTYAPYTRHAGGALSAWARTTTSWGPESFEDGVGFECKHCDYTTPAEECAECEELFPVDILKRSHGNGDYFCSEHLARAEGDDRCAD